MNNNNNNVLQSDNNSPQAEVTNHTEGTTTFIATDAVAIRSAPLSVGARIGRSYFPNDVSTVIEFLNKPVAITSGAWSTGDPAETLLYNQDAWVGVWNNTMWKEKLHGFYGLRATLKVDVVLNANPFQAGRLRLCYYPAAVLNRSKASAHITHRIPLSQLPGMDIGCGDEMITFKIPYVTPARFIELTSSIISWGDIYLAVMSPLVTGSSGPTTADYTVWYSMEDVELFGQTNRNINQQSTTGSRRLAKKINPTETELKPISHVLGSAANFSEQIAKIPILSPWAGPVSWFLNAAKGAAISFGFSKPLNTEKPCLMSANYHYHTTTADGLDNAAPISVNFDAKLRLLDDVGPSGQDEMSINFIKSQWSFLEEFTLSTIDTLGASVYTRLLQPDLFFVNAGTNEFYYTPISYLCKFYGLYRGGIEVKFKLVKTGFHAGSLAVSYCPGPSDATQTLTNSSYLYRTIFDLQEGDECCFRCPYLLPLDFIDVNIAFGRLYVNVVNPLRCPETVSSSIKVLVYVRGATSFQIQKPRHLFLNTTNYVVIPQGGIVDEISEDIVCEAPGDGPVAELDYEFCQECISECSTSILQLFKRYSPFQFNIPSSDITSNIFAFSPFFFSAARFATATFTYPNQMNEFLHSLLIAPYAFWRGGVRIRMTTCTTGSDVNVGYMFRTDNLFTSSTPFLNVINEVSSLVDVNWYAGATSTTPPDSTLQPMMPSLMSAGGNAIQVPYQGPYRMSSVQYAYKATSYVPFEYPRVNVEVYMGATRNRLMSRAFADDFQALFWVGVPMMAG